MKYVKMLGLAAVAAAALMAFVGVGTASATVLCKVEPTEGSPATKGTVCPANQAYTGEIHAVNEGNAVLTTDFLDVTCSSSTTSGTPEKEGGATETVKGPVSTLTFTSCNCPVTVLKKGNLEVHWIPDTWNGTLTSSGAEVTVECSTIFGKIHCIYVTEATDLGTLTSSTTVKNEKGETVTTTATMDIESAGIPRLETNGLCDPTSNWDAKYSVTTPDALFVAAHT